MPRPLVQTAPVSEFGDLPTSAEFNDPHLMDRDQSYVPGFSEMRRNRDLKMAEYLGGLIPASDVPSLSHNLRWARNQNKAGNPDNAKPYAHGRKGYRLVNAQSDVGTEWLKEVPPGAQIGADGSIRNGDTVLMVATAQDAARSEAMKRRLTTERLEGVKASFEHNATAVGANTRGAQPYVTMGSTPDPVSAKAGRK